MKLIYFFPNQQLIYPTFLVDYQNPPSPQIETNLTNTDESPPEPKDDVKPKQNNWKRFVNAWRSKTKKEEASNDQGVFL